MRITQEQLRELLKRPALAKANAPASCAPQPTQLEQGVSDEFHRKVPLKKRDPQKCRISIKDFRVRLLDVDGGCAKFHIDSLRYEGVIEDDTVNHVELVFSPQVKVKTKAEQRTEILIEWI